MVVCSACYKFYGIYRFYAVECNHGAQIISCYNAGKFVVDFQVYGDHKLVRQQPLSRLIDMAVHDIFV